MQQKKFGIIYVCGFQGKSCGQIRGQKEKFGGKVSENQGKKERFRGEGRED